MPTTSADEAIVVLVRLFVVLLAASAAVSIVTRRLALPYSVGLVVFGLVVGAVIRAIDVAVPGDVVLLVFLPALIFEAAYQLDVRALRAEVGSVVLLAGPGVFVTGLVVAVALAAGTGLDPAIGFVIGAIVAATDPVAVIATFRRLGAPARLRALVEAESLFNDGTGVVIFSIAIANVGRSVDPASVVVSFVGVVLVSTAIGLLAGAVGGWLVGRIDDDLVVLTLSVLVAYGTYLLADEVGLSGIIATAVAAIVFGDRARAARVSAHTSGAIDTVWEFAAFLLTALVFLLIGLAVPVRELLDELPAIALAVVGVVAARALLVYGGLAVAQRLPWHGEPMSVAGLHLVFWSGLRGAVAVALALSVPPEIPQRGLIQAVSFGVVLFTLLAQATTIGLVTRRTVGARPADAAA